ncbi:hypothetical protein BRAS3809_10003 [Bradyrhizobium sp. STM 3809]|nr:hypothetical protein BRAS3809_10003 [Bradyrhizobium sp. STM 3809]
MPRTTWVPGLSLRRSGFGNAGGTSPGMTEDLIDGSVRGGGSLTSDALALMTTGEADWRAGTELQGGAAAVTIRADLRQ